MELSERIRQLMVLQEEYAEFSDFLDDALEFLGFGTTWMQHDIGRFMQDESNRFIYISACRGEAKSTIACIYAAWLLLHDPRHRVVLISASSKKAAENGVLVYGLINKWDILKCLKPDRTDGDKVSTIEFDVAGELKGVNKSASVKCLGITSSLQGFRADTLVADDVESTRNGLTPTMREQLSVLTREFSSICTNGRIIYLGTPQTKDSIYNNLPNRGYVSRIWPARFPTVEQEAKYGELLAPSIVERMRLLGASCQTGYGVDFKQGMPTDPARYTEDVLVEKEVGEGPEYFQLQYMLNTSLSDAARMQLKSRNFIVLDCEPEKAPETLVWAATPQTKVTLPPQYPIPATELYSPASASSTYLPLTSITMVVDPAGNGGDTLAYCIGGVCNSYIHILSWGGFKGGMSPENMSKLADLAKEFKVKVVWVEKNMGAGMAKTVLESHFVNTERTQGIGFEEGNSTGQKERRIIDTVRPLLDKHKLVLRWSALIEDLEHTKQWPLGSRADRLGMYQLVNITTDRGCLRHDDNIDALSMLCAQLGSFVSLDEDKAKEKREQHAIQEFLDNPFGYSASTLKQLGMSKSRGYRAINHKDRPRGTRRYQHS